MSADSRDTGCGDLFVLAQNVGRRDIADAKIHADRSHATDEGTLGR